MEGYWLGIILDEIISVTTAMRKNQTWSIDNSQNLKVGFILRPLDTFMDAVPFPGPPQTASLQTGFIVLKSILSHTTSICILPGLRDLDPLVLLEPFLHVVQTGDTNGVITGAALTSLETFINYGILHPHHPNVATAVASLIHSVTRCRFEATDVVADEVVLTQILHLLRTIAISDVGRKAINDKSICEMVEVAFGIYFQSRISELLRRTAKSTLLALVQVIFERLVELTKEKEHRESISSARPTTPRLIERAFFNQDFASHELGDDSKKITKPFGLPAICELIRVLISLIDPSDRAHTDTLHRQLAISLFIRAIEIGGKSLSKLIGYVLEHQRFDSEDLNTVTITPERGNQTSIVYVGSAEAQENEDRFTESDLLLPNASSNDPNDDIKERSIESHQTALAPDNISLNAPLISTQQAIDESPPSNPNLSANAEEVTNTTKELETSNIPTVAANIKQMITEELCKHLFVVFLGINLGFNETKYNFWRRANLALCKHHLIDSKIVDHNVQCNERAFYHAKRMDNQVHY
jgi:hypothetical protein